MAGPRACPVPWLPGSKQGVSDFPAFLLGDKTLPLLKVTPWQVPQTFLGGQEMMSQKDKTNKKRHGQRSLSPHKAYREVKRGIMNK